VAAAQIDYSQYKYSNLWSYSQYQTENQTFYYTRRITPKRGTSFWCPFPRHSAKTTQIFA